MSNSHGPLAGLRILDLSTLIAGPWASTLLGDLGAEVLKSSGIDAAELAALKAKRVI